MTTAPGAMFAKRNARSQRSRSEMTCIRARPSSPWASVLDERWPAGTLPAARCRVNAPTGLTPREECRSSADGSEPLTAFLLANHRTPVAVVISDGLGSYPAACGEDYRHTPFNVRASGLPAHVPLPGCTGSPALANAVGFCGTHQGAVEAANHTVQAYLDVSCFRCQPKALADGTRVAVLPRSCTLAVGAPPLTYRTVTGRGI